MLGILLKSTGGSRPWSHSGGRRQGCSSMVPSPPGARVSLQITSSLSGLSAGRWRMQGIFERTSSAVSQLRGQPQPHSAALCTALVWPGQTDRQVGGRAAVPLDSFYPKQLRDPPCSSWRLQTQAALSEVSIAAALLLQYHFCVLPGYARTAYLLRKKNQTRKQSHEASEPANPCSDPEEGSGDCARP